MADKEDLKQEMTELDAWIKMVRIDSLLTKLCASILLGYGPDSAMTNQQKASWKLFLSQYEVDLIRAVALFEKAHQEATKFVEHQS